MLRHDHPRSPSRQFPGPYRQPEGYSRSRSPYRHPENPQGRIVDYYHGSHEQGGQQRHIDRRSGRTGPVSIHLGLQKAKQWTKFQICSPQSKQVTNFKWKRVWKHSYLSKEKQKLVGETKNLNPHHSF